MFVKGQIATDIPGDWIPVCEIARSDIHVVVDRALWDKICKHMDWNTNEDGNYVFDERVKGGSINYADWQEIGIMMGWLPDIHTNEIIDPRGEMYGC